MESKSKQQQKSNFFHSIETISDAQKVGRQGALAACFVAGMTTLFAVAAMSGALPLAVPIDGWALVDAVIFAIVAWGIYQMSRVAAVAGLVIYILEKVYMQVALGMRMGIGTLMVVVLILAFINGIRGTFAYHRLRKGDA